MNQKNNNEMKKKQYTCGLSIPTKVVVFKLKRSLQRGRSFLFSYIFITLTNCKKLKSMFKKLVDFYNEKHPDNRINRKQVIDKLVLMGLLPSYNSGLQMFNRIDRGEQVKINPEIELALIKILGIEDMPVIEFFNFYNF